MDAESGVGVNCNDLEGGIIGRRAVNLRSVRTCGILDSSLALTGGHRASLRRRKRETVRRKAG